MGSTRKGHWKIASMEVLWVDSSGSKKGKGYKRGKAGGILMKGGIAIFVKGDKALSRERFEKYLSEKYKQNLLTNYRRMREKYRMAQCLPFG